MTSNIEDALFYTLNKISEAGYSFGLGFVGLEPSFVKTTYDETWVEHYLKSGYIKKDPTIKFGHARTGHVTWKQLQHLYPDSKDFFEDAVEHGLVEGNTLSMRVEGQVCLLSCSGKPWGDLERREAKACLSALGVLKASPKQTKSFDIPERVLEVLRLMSGGAKDQEIASLLGVKIETVRARRKSAFNLTSTSTTSQLISEVIKAGAI